MDSLPVVVDLQADADFRAAVTTMFGPSSMELNYVEHEFGHIRHMFTTGVCVARGKVLEYGCNIGATAIILSCLGADVTGVDVNPAALEIARLNAKRFGRQIEFLEINSGTALPFADNTFDLVVCNSVLEYVHPEQLGYQQRELYRVLAPGGRILVFGTSSRLWPKEKHSRSWFNNYTPLWMDSITGRRRARGVWPWKIRHGFGPMKDVLKKMGPDALVGVKDSIGQSGETRWVLLRLTGVAKLLGVSWGLLLPWIVAVLEKDGVRKDSA
jgi:ubiquinone/menaquinone biosynthesis C-methylase UbiE